MPRISIHLSLSLSLRRIKPEQSGISERSVRLVLGQRVGLGRRREKLARTVSADIVGGGQAPMQSREEAIGVFLSYASIQAGYQHKSGIFR